MSYRTLAAHAGPHASVSVFCSLVSTCLAKPPATSVPLVYDENGGMEDVRDSHFVQATQII